MASKKHKRHSGWITPSPTVPLKELIKNDLVLEIYYDDWEDYRDGFRNWFSDFKKIKNIKLGQKKYCSEKIVELRIKMNKKQKRLLRRRKKRLYDKLERYFLSRA